MEGKMLCQHKYSIRPEKWSVKLPDGNRLHEAPHGDSRILDLRVLGQQSRLPHKQANSAFLSQKFN